MFSRIVAYFFGLAGSVLLILGLYLILPTIVSMNQDISTIYGLIALLGGLITHVISYLIWKATQKDSWKAFLFI